CASGRSARHRRWPTSPAGTSTTSASASRRRRPCRRGDSHDRYAGGAPRAWQPRQTAQGSGRSNMLKRTMVAAALAVAPISLVSVPQSAAFCGFYVGKADSSLFNEASQVILARDGRRTTLTMMNDYKGELTDFALVVPVPVVLKRNDVKVIEKKT